VGYYAIEIGTGRRVGMPESNVVLSESNSASLAGFESDLSKQCTPTPPLPNKQRASSWGPFLFGRP